MKIIRKIITLILLISFFAMDIFAEKKSHINDELNEISNNLKKAVLNEDKNYLHEFVAPSGSFFIDTQYTREQLGYLLNAKNSWLYKYLFVGENSINNYFLQAKDIKTNIYIRGPNSAMIIYESSNYPAHNWVENCILKINDRWFFDGIFSCQ